MSKITPFSKDRKTKDRAGSRAREKEMLESGTTGRIDYKDRIRNHRFTVLYRSGLVIALILVVVIAWYVQWKNHTFTDCLVVSSVENTSIRNGEMVEFSGNFITYGKDGASCFDTKGNAVWNVTYEMQNPIVVVNGQMAAIGDFNSRNIFVMDTKGATGEITTTLPIYNFCVSQNGIVAVALNDSDITWIYLYDLQGNQLAYFKTTMQKSGYPLEISISPNGQLVGISYLYLDSGEMRTSIAFYNFGGVGQNKTDNYVSGYNYVNEVVPCLQFIDGKTAYAVSDSRLMFYNGNQVPVSAAEHFVDREILGVYHNEEYVALVVTSDDPDCRYRLDVYNRNGELKSTKDFNIEYKDIILKNDYVYIYNEANCLIYSMSGVVKYDGSLGRSAQLLIPSESISKMTVVSATNIDSMELN